MKTRIGIVLALVAASVALAYSGTREVLVLTTATTITRTVGMTAIELQNLGPSDIYCAPGDEVTADTGRRVDAEGGVWTMTGSQTVTCICPGGAQVAHAGTRVTELP